MFPRDLTPQKTFARIINVATPVPGTEPANRQCVAKLPLCQRTRPFNLLFIDPITTKTSQCSDTHLYFVPLVFFFLYYITCFTKTLLDSLMSESELKMLSVVSLRQSKRPYRSTFRVHDTYRNISENNYTKGVILTIVNQMAADTR